ncbi:hypothetical protein [Variovorax sp. UC74_104]|uniref:hypothetical protein n=1 Tax=Variovorax sp. UC74_104 TaxID=3374555 RepID=UPI003757558B
MAKRMVHNATITLKLPFDLDTDARVKALRAAGVPVDAEGNARQGFLFVRSGDGYRSMVDIFRWFPDEVSPISRDAATMAKPLREQRAAPPQGNTLDHWLARILTRPIPSLSSQDAAMRYEPEAPSTTFG